MGAVDYIAKPFQQTEVLARLKTHLSIRNLQKSLQERNERLQQEINERKRIEAERKQLTEEVKSLRGLLPICVNCKKIRDEDDSWHDVAVYIRDRSEADFTHGLCPECAHELYPGFDQK
jgi:DNA-binding response OmpR family regulator